MGFASARGGGCSLLGLHQEAVKAFLVLVYGLGYLNEWCITQHIKEYNMNIKNKFGLQGTNLVLVAKADKGARIEIPDAHVAPLAAGHHEVLPE